MEHTRTKSKWWPQFSIKDLLIVIALCAMALAQMADRARTARILRENSAKTDKFLAVANSHPTVLNHLRHMIRLAEEQSRHSDYWLGELMKKHLALEPAASGYGWPVTARPRVAR